MANDHRGALEHNPYTSIFALLEGEELQALVDSIAANGIREPIVWYEGKILDGRNRDRAARQLNLPISEIPVREFDADKEGDPIDFVWDMNAHRRHLNETQRGLAAAEMETLRHGGKRKFQEPHAALEKKPATRTELGRRYGVGHTTMHSMSVVRDRGVGELKEIARAGQISVRTAKTIAEMPVDKQKAIIERAQGAPDRCSALQIEAAKEIQIAKLAEMSKRNRVLDPAGKTYDVIYADPPWQFDLDITGKPRAIENHYPTMSVEEISKLPVSRLAARHAILLLWTTDHHLIEADRVVTSWGFRRRARMVWVKNSIGVGRFVRNRHEYLIIATRGDFPAPPSDCVPDSVIEYPRGEHSEKPPLHKLIEKMTPGLDRRIELFARHHTSG
jgi:N6-adenosine-specific RNA methylase IME4